MIAMEALEQANRGRVLCMTVIDGREYKRLKAFADVLNADPRFEDDNTAATVYQNFFTCDCDLNADDCGDAANQVSDAIFCGDDDELQNSRELTEKLVLASGEELPDKPQSSISATVAAAIMARAAEINDDDGGAE